MPRVAPLQQRTASQDSIIGLDKSKRTQKVKIRHSIESIPSKRATQAEDLSTRPSVFARANAAGAGGVGLKAVLPAIINEQNRKTYGTWQRQLDFTRTILGYILGIHNFFRFPYLCYKYGGIFFVPYLIMMVLVGIPTVFMEFTIGQYCGVGSYVAFTHMAPILSGVSKLLTWSCVVNCWMYTVIMAWIRIYSNDSTSCLKAWELCGNHFYNSPFCWTGIQDDECDDINRMPTTVIQHDSIYYNYGCRTVEYYCKTHGWMVVPGSKKCVDINGTQHSIYERRFHASQEFFYGAVVGLRRGMEEKYEIRRNNLTLHTFQKTFDQLLHELFPSHNLAEDGNKKQEPTDGEIIREFGKRIRSGTNKTAQKMFSQIHEDLLDATLQNELYWTKEGKSLTGNIESSSFVQVQEVSMTTWIMIGVFLFEDLLKISFMSYLVNAVPFLILIYVTYSAISFTFSGYGIGNLLTLKDGYSDFLNVEMWTEAVIQVIYTTGVGNGVLISIATFNNFNHGYLIDLFCTMGLTITTSLCAVIICFCSLGHYLKAHDIDIPFRDYIQSESRASSVEFCFLTYSHYLTLRSDDNILIFIFFFMFTSFATDTAVRLVQNVLDTLAAISPRLKHHSTPVLVAVCLMGFLTLIPVMTNGGIVLFIDYEYFTLRYMMPTIVLIQTGATLLIYKAERIVDNAEQMSVFTSQKFRKAIIFLMYISCAVMLATVIINIFRHDTVRYNGVESVSFTESFGWVFFISPVLMVSFSVIKQLAVVPHKRWWWLLIPLMGKDRKLRRAFLRRIQGGKPTKTEHQQETDHEAIRLAALRWRTLEARLMEAISRRKEVQMNLKRKSFVEQQPTNNPEMVRRETIAVRGSGEEHGNLTHLIRVAAANKQGAGVTSQKENKLNEYLDPNQNRTSVYEIDENFGENDAIDYRKRWRGFIHIKSDSFFVKLKAAFWGRALQGDSYRPKRHIGGRTQSKTKMHVMENDDNDEQSISGSEGDEDKDSQETASQEDVNESSRINYLDFMDYFERWPGRLDESDIESEGSSVEDDMDADNDEFYY